MKIRTCAALLIGLLTFFLLTGCAAQAVEYRLEQAEDAVEEKLDQVEDRVEHALRETPAPTKPAEKPTLPAAEPTVPPATEATSPAATEAAGQLTGEEAKAIALAHAGFTADQVQHLRAEYEMDDGVPHYDIEFREGPWEYDYEIHAGTGQILSFEKDD